MLFQSVPDPKALSLNISQSHTLCLFRLSLEHLSLDLCLLLSSPTHEHTLIQTISSEGLHQNHMNSQVEYIITLESDLGLNSDLRSLSCSLQLTKTKLGSYVHHGS